MKTAAITATVKGVKIPKDATLVTVKGKTLPDYKGRIKDLLTKARAAGQVKLATLIKGQPNQSRAMYLVKALVKGGYLVVKKAA